jgi:hypothetical protein
VARRLGVTMVSGRTLGLSLAVVSAGLVLMVIANATTTWTRLLPGLVLAGLGVGLANPSIAATALAVVEPARAGLTSGVSNACRVAGITLGVAGLGAVQRNAITASVHSGSHGSLVDLIASGQLRLASHVSNRGAVDAAYSHGLHVTLLVGAAVVGAGAISAVSLIPRPKPAVTPAPVVASEGAPA